MLIEATHYHHGNGNQASWLSCKDLDQGNSGSGTRRSGDILLVIRDNIATRGNSRSGGKSDVPIPTLTSTLLALGSLPPSQSSGLPKGEPTKSSNAWREHGGSGQEREQSLRRHMPSANLRLVALYILSSIHQCHWRQGKLCWKYGGIKCPRRCPSGIFAGSMWWRFALAPPQP